MHLKQYYLGCLAHASYMIGCDKSKTAIVIDPQRDIAQYITDADAAGFTIKHVFLSHFHADFVAGHLELRKKTSATIHLGAQAQAEFEFEAMADGSTLELETVKLEILETPGHTPEGISIVVYDLENDADTPKAVLTGDTLFIGDVGRPDLMASIGVTAEELAGSLYDSLHNKLMTLPDATLLYPAHGAGSMCGKNLSSDTVSTIGAQRANNYALQPMSKEEFIAIVTANQPIAPNYFSYDAMLNRKEHTTLSDSMANLKPLELKTVLSLIDDKEAQLVDARLPSDYADAHMNKSLSVELEGKFATWAGTFLDPLKPIVIIADAGTEVEAGLRLGRIGFDLVAGYLEGGMRALAEAPKFVGNFERLSSGELERRISESKAPLVLDVRTPGEYASGHIPGAINIPLNEIRERAGELRRDQEVIATCRTGSRSCTAVSILRMQGFTNVGDQRGGFVNWNNGSRAIEKCESTCGS